MQTELWEGQGRSSIDLEPLIVETGRSTLESDSEVDAYNLVVSDAELRDYDDWNVSSAPYLKCLFHRHFNGMELTKVSQIAGNPWRFENDISYGRVKGPIPKIPDSRGTTSRQHSGSVTGSSLSATTPDNTKVIIIDPVQGLVRVLDSSGNVLFREILGLDVFADVLTVTADNETYWLLRWVSANHKGGNKFDIERRRIEDHTIVEMTWESLVKTVPVLATDRVLETKPVLTISTSSVKTVPVLATDRVLETKPVLTTLLGLGTEPQLMEYTHVEGVRTTPVFFEELGVIRTTTELSYPFSKQGLRINSELQHDEWIVTDSALSDARVLETEAALEAPSYGVMTKTALSEIRIELRLPGQKIAPFYRMFGYDATYNFRAGVRAADERNLFPSYYNLENDVHRLYNPIWPIRVSEAQHEMPYHETDPLYYGHPLHYAAAEAEGFELDDLFYVPEQHVVNENIIMKTSHVTSERVINTRQVTAPHLVASETRLVFGTVKHRGAWPWENEHVDESDLQRRSSKTLFVELDPDTRWPTTPSKCVNASAAAGIKANDDLGVVMLDYYWRTTPSGHIPRFLDDSTHDIDDLKVKCATLIRLDFNFNKKAVLPCIPPKNKIINETIQYNYEQLSLGEGEYPYLQVLSTVFRQGLSAYTGTGLMNLPASETSFNGLFHLVGDHIVWLTDQMLAAVVHEPRQESGGMDDLWHYPWAGSPNATVPGNFSEPHNRIQVYDKNFISRAEFYTNIPHTSFLCISLEDDVNAISTRPVLLPHGYFNYLLTVAEAFYHGQSTPLITNPVLTTTTGISLGVDLVDSRGVATEPVLSPAGYSEELVLITNSSLVEPADMFSEHIVGDNNRSHPTGQTGTYPYGVRYWELGIGYPTGKGFLLPKQGGTGGYYPPLPGYEAWGGDSLYHNPALCWRPKLPTNFDDFDPKKDVFEYHNDGNFPHPVQFISDNVNNELFGLFRLPEGRTWMAGFQELRDGESEGLEYWEWYGTRGPDVGYLFNRHDNIGSRLYPDGLGFWLNPNDSACVTYPIGGVLHKYDKPNKDPIKSVIIPGFLKNNTTKEYDPFVTCRYFGNSPSNKRLYVIRALGRPDFFHTSMRTFNMNQSSPWVRLPGEGYEYKLNSLQTAPNMPTAEDPSADLQEYPDLYIHSHPYNPSSIYTIPPPKLRGWMPDDSNAMALDFRDYTPWNHYDYITTMENHMMPYEYTWELPGGDKYIKHNTDNLEYYEQKVNTYEVRDILVFDYDLNYLRKIPVPESIPEDETILHIVERGGVFYLLTQKKAENTYNWAQFHATRGVGTPLEHGYQDDKYGYKFVEVRLYKVDSLTASTNQLLVKLPWAGHSVGDTLIQEVTDTHVWLNWSGVHKTRAGTCLGLAVRLDGSGYEELPGLLAILYDHHIVNGWSLLVYKNSANRPSCFHAGQYGDFMRHQAERWNRYGDGRVTAMVVLDEATLTPMSEEVAYQPMNDTPRLAGRHCEVGMTSHPDEFYPNAPQPGYSQVYKRKNHYFITTEPVLVEDPESAKPRTWVTTTKGGPNITDI